MRSARLLLALLAALALASCGDDEPAAEPAATAAPATESTAEPAPAEDPVEPSGGGGASPYIGSLSVDPGDGTLMIGTGLGLYRLEPGERRARKLEGALETPEGAGTISANLELLHLGPGELLASGHPQSGDLPEDIGLVRSGDHGDTWSPVSGLGEFDWHLLERSRELLAGVPADGTELYISHDAGVEFSRNGVAPSPPVDVAIDPADPERWVASTAEGIATSEDGGATWRPREPMPERAARLARAGRALPRRPGRPGVGERGRRGDVGGARRRGRQPEHARRRATEGALYLALPGAVIKRSTDGARTWKEVTTLD